MFSKEPVKSSTQDDSNKQYCFPIKGQNSIGEIKRIENPGHIDQEAARTVLVESFIGEYEKYLSPHEISDNLTSWRDGDHCVQKYYEDYFKTELAEFSQGSLDYWIQATIDEKLVGWATFQREKSDQNAVYMNLLVVHPEYQNRGIGGQLVKSLANLNEIPDLNAIHLLLRKKNQGGRIFYSKLGFNSDPEYQRDDNFVDLNLLEGWTWKNPSLQHKDTACPNVPSYKNSRNSTLFKTVNPVIEEPNEQYDTYCGFKPGFLIGKRF